MTDVADVRSFLSGLVTTRVSDDTIEKQIEVANTTVESEKGQMATQEQVDDAKLVYASWLTLAAYASQIERSTGGTPPEVSRQLAFLETLAKAMLSYVKRASIVLQPIVAQPETLDKQYEQGDLAGEAH